LTETPSTICLTRWDFGVDPDDESTLRGDRDGNLINGFDGFSCLQETELTLLNSGLVKEGKPGFGNSSLQSLGSKGVGFLKWVFRGVGEEEYRSLSMNSLCLWRGKCFAERREE